MAQSFTLDQLIIERMEVLRSPGQDVVVTIWYTLTDSSGQFRSQGRSFKPTLNQSTKNTLNALWDAGVTSVKNNEGIP